MKKYLAELVGTFVLTFLGCGAAVALGCGADTASVVGTAFAFGLAVVAMAYTIGGISGCHINPAISLGCFLSGRMTAKDCGMYIVFQVIGAILAAAVLAGIVGTAPAEAIITTKTGANACAFGVTNGLIVEIVLTMLFVGTGHRFVAHPDSLGRYPLHWHLGEPRPFNRPGFVRGWTSSVRSLGIHRRPIRRWCFGCMHLENHRLRLLQEN